MHDWNVSGRISAWSMGISLKSLLIFSWMIIRHTFEPIYFPHSYHSSRFWDQEWQFFWLPYYLMRFFASLLIWKFCVRKISGFSNSFNKILQWTMLNDQLFLVINCKLRKMRRRKDSAFQWFINFDFFDVPWKLWKESSITVWEIWMYYFNKSRMGNTRIMIFIFWVKSAN